MVFIIRTLMKPHHCNSFLRHENTSIFSLHSLPLIFPNSKFTSFQPSSIFQRNFSAISDVFHSVFSKQSTLTDFTRNLQNAEKGDSYSVRNDRKWLKKKQYDFTVTEENGALGRVTNPDLQAKYYNSINLPKYNSHFPDKYQKFSSSLEIPLEGIPKHLEDRYVKHWFKDWHHLRRNRLTSSTFSSAVGFHNHKRIGLWKEKIGYKEHFYGNDATFWNASHEEHALERYKLLSGNEVSCSEFQIYRGNNQEDGFIGCSPDGIIGNDGVLEIKCPYFGDDDVTKYLPWGQVPPHYIPQAQGLMEILDRDWLDFYVWMGNKGSVDGTGSDRSSLFRIYRNREYWEILKIALYDFWWYHVQPAKELYNNNVVKGSLQELKFWPAPRHELYGVIHDASERIADESQVLFREIDGQILE